MGSHVGSKIASCCARVFALCTNKRLLSAVNQHVDFQLGRCITRISALVAIVTLLCVSLKFFYFYSVGHLEAFLFFPCGLGSKAFG